jgi:adenylate cyclase
MQLSDANLSRLVERFEDGVADRIADHGGQLVKTIGDEVLFTTDNPASLVQIASGLLREFTSDPYVGALRIGLSYGRPLGASVTSSESPSTSRAV